MRVSADESVDEVVDFNRDVRPIFNQHCVACHGGVKQAGDLSLVYEEQVLGVIEPGDPEASYLLDRVTDEDDEERMPPAAHGRRLSKTEVDMLRRWIAQSAKWRKHWSFEVPTKRALPPISQTGWPRERMDVFILARLESSGLAPSPAAKADRWLRRVTLDLTGLPPTLKKRTAFLKAVEQTGESAYTAEVERLLDSPHFGERWASMWLDLVRYADSQGLGQDGPREIWKYRDWVIRAFNDDMPYDEFTVKQIAGDLLDAPTMDDLVATAGQRLTQTNEEGGTNDEQFRIEAVIDRVNTTWQVWQGLTFGCVQCHSHPYDPIRHEEYYRFLAFFNNTLDTDLSNDDPRLKVPLDLEQQAAARAIDVQMAQLKQTDWAAGYALLSDHGAWQPLKGMTAESSTATNVVVEPTAEGDEYHTTDTVKKQTGFTLTAPLPDGVSRLTAIRFSGLPLDADKAAKDTEVGFVVTHLTAELLPVEGEPILLKIARVISDDSDPLLDPQESLDAKSKHGFGAYTYMTRRRDAAFVLDEAVDVPAGARLRVTAEHGRFYLGAFPLVARRGQLAFSDDARFTDWLHGQDRVADREQLAKLSAERAKMKSVAIPVLVERPEERARTTRVFERGNYLTKGEIVEPATPLFLASSSTSVVSPSTRLELAHWVASDTNPLTARVAVNRVWARIFGIGLVETQEDFGSSGESPSHPDLLDDLAVRFSNDMSWSTKSLLKEIALSATYRQSAIVTPERIAADPRNRLLGRGPRQRLPAETVRDQALAVSGLLSDKLFGPPVHPPIPDGVWKPFKVSDKWTTPEPNDEDRYRRSIYTYTKRSIPYPMFAAFDAPSREFCTARRIPSNTPVQALTMLNDLTFEEAGRAFTNRMSAGGKTLDDQLRFGVSLVTGREPREDEVERLRHLHEQTLDRLRDLVTAGAEIDEAQLAIDALSNIATVLLNLDEVMCQ